MSDQNDVKISQKNDKTRAELLAQAGLSSTLLNTLTTLNFAKGAMGEIGLTEAVDVMRGKVKQVTANNTTGLEETLTAQATALDAIFNELARRAALNMGEYLHATESYMRLALKAQAQCTRTIEVIASMKNPPVIFAKQANIANGNQQVNNGSVNNGQQSAQEEKIVNQSNELLSENQDATLDTRGTAATIGTNKAMAAVEK